MGYDKKVGDKHELENKLEKDPKKERPSSIVTFFQSFFNEEAKEDIKSYQFDNYVAKLNQWLQ